MIGPALREIDENVEMFMFMFMFIIIRLYSLRDPHSYTTPSSTVSQHNSSPTKRRVSPSNSVAVRRVFESGRYSPIGLS